MARTIHWIAVAGIFSILVLDHLPERTPELLTAVWNDTPPVVSDAGDSDWDTLPIMYD